MPNDVLMFAHSGVSIAMGKRQSRSAALAARYRNDFERTRRFRQRGPSDSFWTQTQLNRTERRIQSCSGSRQEILGWYGSDNPGTLTNLARLLNHGRLAGTGKVIILPVDQGFEHGPARSFCHQSASAYDPRYPVFPTGDQSWLQRVCRSAGLRRSRRSRICRSDPRHSQVERPRSHDERAAN